MWNNEPIRAQIIGRSKAIAKLQDRIAMMAPLDATVLICGESGTGKELVARAFHANNPRAGRPFVPVNCSALPEHLVESELFGHERGAFTDAHVLKPGQFEQAEGGSVFLDEIGDMPPSVQPKLLRVIQERVIKRLGGTKIIPVDVRLIAATNRNLENDVTDGWFREDLYYRLNVFFIRVPSLRERREDILLLANHFLLRFAQKHSRAVSAISTDAQELLKGFDWPGNVRQLENVMEQAVGIAKTPTIGRDDLSEQLSRSPIRREIRRRNYRQSVSDNRKELVNNAIRECHGNLTAAARMLGMHRSHLYRLISKDDHGNKGFTRTV